MVLGWRRLGRVGRCRIPWKEKTCPWGWVFSFHITGKFCFPDYPDQCATLYLVRIFSAARCAGFRQEKSPGRVGRCRIPWKKDSPLTGWVLFSFHLQRFYSLVVFNQCATLYLVRISSPAPCGRNRGPISPGRVGQSQTDVRGFFLCAFVPSFPLSDRVQPSPNIKKQNTITVHLFTQSQKRFKRTVHALYKIYVFLRQKKQKEK